MIFQLKCFYDLSFKFYYLSFKFYYLSIKMFLLSFRHESEEASDFSEDVGMTKRARLSPTHSGYSHFRLNKDKKFLNYNNKQTFLNR
jgi:hypothetical protein